MRRLFIAIVCALAAGAASPLAWGDDPPPPAVTGAVEPVTVPSSPDVAADPAPKPDPSPPVPALEPPKLEADSPPAPVAAQPAAPAAQPSSVAPSAKPKLKRTANPKKKPKQKPPAPAGSGKEVGLPEPAASKPMKGGSVGAGAASVTPPVPDREGPDAGEGASVAGLVEPPSEGGGTIRAALSIVLFGLLGAAIALFGLAAVPPGAFGGAVVTLIVATRRVELAAGGALMLVASATILAVISLSS